MELSQTRPNETDGSPAFSDALCAVNGTRGSFAAVEQASALVGPTGQLTLLAVTAVTGSGQYRSAAISPSRADRVLAWASKISEAAGVRTARMVETAGPPDAVILEEASRHELLAMGAPAASPLGGMLADGVGTAALKALTTPLLAARPARARAEQFAGRLLVASDGSDASDAVVELAARLAGARGASVVLLHAVGVESQSSRHCIERQGRDLERACGRHFELRILAGGAREQIVKAAADPEVSLIVMGSRRLGGLRVLGSVSRHVVHEAGCSVLLVPPREPE